MNEIYISTDIEANGPIPGEYSMLSLGSVALDKNGTVLGKFYKKLLPLKGAMQHPQTMGFWEKYPEAYKEAISNPEDPIEVMNEYADWLESLSKRYKKEMYFVAYPSSWDFMFVSWYLVKFVERYQENHFIDIPFHHAAIDIRTFIMAHLKKSYSESSIKLLPQKLLKVQTEKLIEHSAIDDALKQGLIFINLLKENQGGKK